MALPSKEQTAAYFKNSPQKRSGAAVMFFNGNEELMIVKPNYKTNWLLPGGTIDENESPLAAARREVMEEIGLEIHDLRPLCVDYVSGNDFEPDRYHFVFHGGTLNEEQIKRIVLQETELDEFRFVTITEALSLVSKPMQMRMGPCLESIQNQVMVYLQNGNKIK